jgi:hypothetical protein
MRYRLLGDKAPGLDYPPDGGRGRDGTAMRPAQMDRDRVGPRVESRLAQFLSDADDLVFVAAGDLGG